MDPLQYDSLWQAVKEVPDPRHAHGTRYPWLFLVTLICASLLAGNRRLIEIIDWVRWNGDGIHRAWPEPLPGPPSYARLRCTLLGLDVQHLEQVMPAHGHTVTTAGQSPAAPAPPVLHACRRWRDTAGHPQVRDRRPDPVGESGPTGTGSSLGPKADGAEITAVVKLLEGLNLRHTVTTLGALLTPKTIARLILKQHGNYLMVVKANQPEL